MVIIEINNWKEAFFMTTLRQSAMKELEKLPEDKISFILQIMQIGRASCRERV